MTDKSDLEDQQEEQTAKSVSPVNKQAGQAQPVAGSAKAVEIALPTAASDTDLIEKEWVEKAKQIVDHTRDDPHEQQRALAQMKAEYMKKRYNRDTKSGEK